MLWMIPLALAAAGALADKKNPIRGAAIGAGVGLTGGAAAGGLLGAGAAAGAGAGAAGAGAAGAAGAAGTGGLLAGGAAQGAAGAGIAGLGDAGAMYAGTNAAAASSLGGGASVANGAALGSGGTGLLGTMQQYGKPAMQLANSGLLGGGQEQPAPQNPIQDARGGYQTLSQLAQEGEQTQQNIMQEEAMRKKRRASLLGG